MKSKLLEERLGEWFEEFHRNPELSYEEYGTTARIREILEAEGIEIEECALETGLVAVIRGSEPGPVQALRCDIDALPIQEESGLSYSSCIPGKMHACGHDFHVTAGLGAACLLSERRKELAGTVKIIFQPGEESSLGALKVLETAVMENVERIWGLHADPTNETGTLGIRAGYVTAAVDRFVVTVKGEGCHGAHPDDGADPIPAACAMVQAFQTIVTRNVNAFHPALISVTRFEAGNTWNVIPEKAVLEGTVRTMDREDRELFSERLHTLAARIAGGYGVEAETDWISGPPAVENDSRMAQLAVAVGEKQGFQIVEEEQSMGGDDFSFYEKEIPGCYVKVGTGKGQLIHQPGFRVDRRVLLPAAEYLAELLIRGASDM